MTDARPFTDVRVTEGGLSLPELKWRELLFIGALRARGEIFVRDASRPLPPFETSGLFPDDARFAITAREGGRVHLRRVP
jgi:hypothetical protein